MPKLATKYAMGAVNDAKKVLLKTGAIGLMLFIVLVTVGSIFMERRAIASYVQKEEEATEKALENMTGYKTV